MDLTYGSFALRRIQKMKGKSAHCRVERLVRRVFDITLDKFYPIGLGGEDAFCKS